MWQALKAAESLQLEMPLPSPGQQRLGRFTNKVIVRRVEEPFLYCCTSIRFMLHPENMKNLL